MKRSFRLALASLAMAPTALHAQIFEVRTDALADYAGARVAYTCIARDEIPTDYLSDAFVILEKPVSIPAGVGMLLFNGASAVLVTNAACLETVKQDFARLARDRATLIVEEK